MTRSLALVLPVAVPLLFLGASEADAGEKITICHNTSSAKNPIVMIEISVNALDKHVLNHGDADPYEVFEDGDSDGFGAPGTGTLVCETPDGYVENDDDSDDTDPDSEDDGGGDDGGGSGDVDPCSIPGIEC